MFFVSHHDISNLTFKNPFFCQVLKFLPFFASKIPDLVHFAFDSLRNIYWTGKSFVRKIGLVHDDLRF